MNPVTALGFVSLGGALWCLVGWTETSKRKFRTIAFILAGLVALVGALKLVDYIIGLGFHVDELFFPAKLRADSLYPQDEMAPNTALNFLCCGLAVLLSDVQIRGRFSPGQAFILTAGLISLLALIGYSYHVLILYRFGAALPMALDTAIAFSVFCLGYLAAQPRRGLMVIVTSGTTGGAMARRLLPTAILIPWILGATLLMVEQAGYYEKEFALSIFAVTSIVTFTSLIWWNAKLLFLADLERVQTERRLAAQHNGTRVLAEASDLSQAMPKILRMICETLGWQMGAMWTVDANTNTMRCTELWHSPAVNLHEFIQATRNLAFAKGIGLPGRVWAQAQPVWIQDVTKDENYPRGPAAAKVGLHGAFGIPILIGQEVFGVIEFASHDVEHPDPTLLDMLATVGTQVGLFVERTRAEAQLRQTSANLQRSNTDLQQFAYVASHDLFEPLRMVTSYLQLLGQRYQGKLDKQAQEFIGFALDGAKRMDALIHDLLAYSRVDIRGRSFEPTDCEQVLRAAISNLKVAIEESGAKITHERLPKVRADIVQLTQVFQNLIGNAIKFRGSRTPEIDVHVRRRENEWLFSVRDNGIGIEPKHFERIFVIFQRLHTRQEYAGTGMGLAICKKIIERHGGHIWVESTPGEGSVFFFTLPVMQEG